MNKVKHYYKLKKKHIDYFVKMLEKWQKKLDVVGWEFVFNSNKPPMDCKSCCVDYYTDRLTMFYTSKKWDIKPTKKNIDCVAFHEVCEIFLVDIEKMIDINRKKKIPKKLIIKEKHRIIRTLENLLFKN